LVDLQNYGGGLRFGVGYQASLEKPGYGVIVDRAIAVDSGGAAELPAGLILGVAEQQHHLWILFDVVQGRAAGAVAVDEGTFVQG